MNKTIIKNATIVDGTGSPSFVGDLFFNGKQIVFIDSELEFDGAEQINAEGLILAPGFIDVHSHSDFTLLVNPYAEGKISQGITTEVIGNCGQSAFPLKGECKEHIQKSWERFNLKLDWEDLPSYRKKIQDKGIAVNVAPLMGQGNIRASIMGYTDKPPTPAQLKQMQQLTQEAMDQGAFGISTGLIYLPGAFSKQEELISVMQEVGKKKGVYATHLRNEGDTLLEAIEEAVDIAFQSNTSLQLSHLKTWGPQNWDKCTSAFNLIQKAQDKGISVHFDRYPYLAAYTDLDALLPSWAYEGGKEKEIQRLNHLETRNKITQELLQKAAKQEGFWETILISSVVTEKNKPFEGLSLQQIALKQQLEPIEALYKILIEEKLEVGAVFFAMCEENLKTIYQHKDCMIGSDSCARPFKGPLADGKFHPRTYGTFPRFFAEFVRTGLLSWEKAIYRATGLAAEKFGFYKRGKLLPGYFADLVLFDPNEIKDQATFKNPICPSTGIKKVWVNGELVLDGGKQTEKLAGEFLLKNECL